MIELGVTFHVMIAIAIMKVLQELPDHRLKTSPFDNILSHAVLSFIGQKTRMVLAIRQLQILQSYVNPSFSWTHKQVQQR